jgi:formylglycine-generating enzyme required for sulfatase activity
MIGSTAPDAQRRGYLKASPLHATRTAGYLAATTEVTIGQWAAFLRALPAEQRAPRTPSIVGRSGALTWRFAADGGLAIELEPSTQRYQVDLDGELRYPTRAARQTHRVRELPVSGITADDAEAYARWLATTGQVANARLCTEREWERLARGADDRPYPVGTALTLADGNLGLEGTDFAGYGPDQVGTHPAGASVYGAQDLSGNVWEIVASSSAGARHAVRGGSYALDGQPADVSFRDPIDAAARDLTMGTRICAGLSP